ncbi:MAG: anti-sigma factor [Verrucomicrobiota bacterium]
MINEQLEEQASLYVLGLLPESELAEFEKQLPGHADLRELVKQLQASADWLALTTPQIVPAADLKSKILAAIDRKSGAPDKIVPLRNSAGFSVWFPWSLAACFAILAAVSFSEKNSVHQEITELHAKVSSLEKNLAALENKDRFSQMRIAVLNSLLENSPKAVAVSVWDKEKQNGVLIVENLQPLPPDKDYQLWVIDSRYANPVDAGVFQVDAAGKVRFQFKPKLPITNFEKVAVSQERKGGVPKAVGPMVLLGS